MGVGEARNRTRRAVERTAPFGLICFSMVTVWSALHGHAPDDVASDRARARWYTTKTEPSYDDTTIKPRRVVIAARFRSPCPKQATPQEAPSRPHRLSCRRNMINKTPRNTSGPRSGRFANAVAVSRSPRADASSSRTHDLPADDAV
jgi:hypothetical protein